MNIPELTDDEATVLRYSETYYEGGVSVSVVSLRSRLLIDDIFVTDIGRAALAAYDAKQRAKIGGEAMTTHFRIHAFDEWHEEVGAVLWFTLPIEEPPWCGTPNDDDWPWVWTEKEDTCWCRLPSFFIDDDAAKFLRRDLT